MAGSAARGGGLLVTVGVLVFSLFSPATASSAGPPEINDVWASQVQSSSARLHAEINPNGLATGFHIDYIPASDYQANIGAGADGFDGGRRLPVVGEAAVGSGSDPVSVQRQISGLQPGTSYRYRFSASNADGQTLGPVKAIHTFAQPPGQDDSCPNAVVRQQTGARNAGLLDCRAYEMVSPVEMNGGQVDPPGALSQGGVLQAAGGGGAVTYGSAASFGDGAQGAPGASQYISRRSSGGWQTENITVPIFSGSFWGFTQGVPYRLFSPDLARGLLLSGRHCRGEETDCPVSNPPLSGTDAPSGYQNYYLRSSSGPGYEALIGPGDLLHTDLRPDQFAVSFAGASPDLRHIVISTCAALTAGASEVADSEGCNRDAPNLYLWSQGSVESINANMLPVVHQGAELAAQSRAVSADGSRVYWVDLSNGNLLLYEAGQSAVVDQAAGGGGNFETASLDGSVAYFTKDAHLWRYTVASGVASDLTPEGGVSGVLGASSDGSRVYFQDAEGLKLWQGGATSVVALGAAAAASENFPPTTGTARVSADGELLVFLSTQSLTGYDNTGLISGEAESQVFLYDDSGSGSLRCLSCNRTNARPAGPSTVPGAIANGTGAEATHSYKPRVLAAGGRRVFFESRDVLVLTDTNNATDVYQWQARGTGSCDEPGGCIALISSGRGEGGASFVDASSGGGDAFFLTSRSLVSSDPGAVDLYDARIGGGFPLPPAPIPCEGDACQSLSPEPHDPGISTLQEGRGNPEVHYRGATRNCFPIARRAQALRRLGIRAGRRAQRASHPTRVRRLHIQSARLTKKSRNVARIAIRCRRANSGVGR